MVIWNQYHAKSTFRHPVPPQRRRAFFDLVFSVSLLWSYGWAGPPGAAFIGQLNCFWCWLCPLGCMCIFTCLPTAFKTAHYSSSQPKAVRCSPIRRSISGLVIKLARVQSSSLLQGWTDAFHVVRHSLDQSQNRWYSRSVSPRYTVLGPLSCKRDRLSQNGTLGAHRSPDCGFAFASSQQLHPRQVNSLSCASIPLPLKWEG